ncbi:oocyte zinc finger protein XlCOF8.4-like [Ranitomeya imitator]|uniref:oocyte zinc finger protein XlCOF8.4-like n=1 Tax=Ranitomeya imitator TaxID=111125 RepID=UPI0037E95850
MKLSRLDDLTEPLAMDEARKHLIDQIMHITLDILYLLTGEDYVVLKMSGGRVTHSSSPIVSGGFCRNLSPNQDPQPAGRREEGTNNQKILELTNTITQLLTGELPIGCQDVTVYFSMEECDDLEKPNASVLDVRSGDQQQNPSPDGSQNTETCRESPSEEYSAPQCEFMSESPGSQTLVIKQEETYEMIDQKTEEAVPEDTSDHTGTPSVSSFPEKPHGPSSLENSSEDDVKILQDKQCNDFKIDMKSMEDGEEVRNWDELCREEEFPKNHNRAWVKKSVTENAKTPHLHQTEKEKVPEERDLHPRANFQLPSLIAVDEEDIRCLQPTAAWEIQEDGSTHLMTSGGPLDPERKFTLISGTTSDALNETKHYDVNAYFCTDCGKCFTDLIHLESHQKVHSIPALFICAECGKSFTTSSELDTHIKVHTDAKLFACSECGKCFTAKSNLLAHKVIHIGEKPFACAECGRRFTSKSSLSTHMSVHALEKPYACSICGKCFTSNARLTFHRSTHLGEKAYECEQCRKVFTTSGSLNRHKRTHTGEKPFACRICGKCFNRETNLYRHQTIHTR